MFLCSLRESTSSFEVEKVEVFFVVEKDMLPDFEVTVTGQGLLAAFGWDKDQEEHIARYVGIDGISNWNGFG